MNLRDHTKVITNFKALTEDDKEPVPHDSYRRVKASINKNYEVQTDNETKN